MQFSDNLLLGPVVPGGPTAASGLQAGNDVAGPSPQMRGIGPVARVYTYNIVPAALAVNNIALVQTTPGAANLVLTAGAGVTKIVDATGASRYQLDVPRAVSLTVAAVDLSGINFTIKGYDVYGQPMTQTLAGPNANTVNTLKAFYQVTSVAVDAAVGTNVSVGTSDIFGLPVAILDAGYIVKSAWNNTLAQDAGTFVAAVVTSPSTAALGDVRGTYKPSANASNGARRLVLTLHLTGLQVGPQATRVGALGVDQV